VSISVSGMVFSISRFVSLFSSNSRRSSISCHFVGFLSHGSFFYLRSPLFSFPNMLRTLLRAQHGLSMCTLRAFTYL